MTRRDACLAALLVGVSTAATLVAAELALRIAHGSVSARPSAAAGMQLVGQYPAVYDPQLGYAPRPHTSGTANVWKREVTIDAAGLRSNGRPRPAGRPVLALGDSFTFGDEVDDADTWPAQLEKLLGRPVLNGGVFGYGVDQMVLRGERLLAGEAAEADWVVLSVLPDDVRRCEFSYRYAWKPYFVLANGGLALRNTPPPEPHEGPPGESGLRRLLRSSFLADLGFRLLDPDGWALPDSVRVHADGDRVARRLLDRLIEGTRAGGRRLLLALQWTPGASRDALGHLADRARESGVPVLDLGEVLEPAVRERGFGAAFHYSLAPGRTGVGHLNPRGNRLVAEAIAAALRSADPGPELPAGPDGV